MTILNVRIVIMTPTVSAIRFLTLIVISKDLRRVIFLAYHTIPVRAYMKRYTSLLVIRVRSSWIDVRKDIFD